MGERVPPYSALHKNPRFLNADIRKVQSRGNARAHVFKVRLISPAIVTKMRGAEAISAAASSASRCSETRGSVRFEHAHAKRKFQPLLAPHCSDALGGAARAGTAAAAEALKQRPHGESIFRSALLMTGGEARPEGRARRLA